MFEKIVFSALPLYIFAFCYTMTARHLVECSFSLSEETQYLQLDTRKNIEIF